MVVRDGSVDEAGYSAVDKSADIKVLHDMGYARELERRMSRFSTFAISFSSAPLRGSPIGEEILRHQAAIRAAETAVGETGRRHPFVEHGC